MERRERERERARDDGAGRGRRRVQARTLPLRAGLDWTDPSEGARAGVVEFTIVTRAPGQPAAADGGDR